MLEYFALTMKKINSLYPSTYSITTPKAETGLLKNDLLFTNGCLEIEIIFLPFFLSMKFLRIIMLLKEQSEILKSNKKYRDSLESKKQSIILSKHVL